MEFSTGEPTDSGWIRSLGVVALCVGLTALVAALFYIAYSGDLLALL